MHFQRWKKSGDPHYRKIRMLTCNSYLSGGIGYIELTKGYWAIVDPEDYERVRFHRWYAQCSHGKTYAFARIDDRTVGLHNYILGTPEGFEGDHINRDTLDDRRSNLRVVTSQQNVQNRGLNRNNTSGYKGFNLRKGYKYKKWCAEIWHNRKKHCLGFFADPKDAARAYNAAARKFGFIYVPPDPD